ncbi:MAG: hypothetical protein NZM31_03195 [Gemmatales bacterium]|nr:hypothetical protein [Gemmatales bacterium]MDW8386006.1 hypothetical protein [Gemmatales bacterium]
MRLASLVAAVLTCIAAASPVVHAQQRPVPHHRMNLHPPFIIHNCYWHPGGYSIWGPTDIGCPEVQPVNHIGPPPFGPRCWYCPPPAAPADDGRWFRSPRDFFMLPIPH